MKGGGKDQVKGKGKKGAFQGECHWCGQWGHPASRCPDKDSYMEWVRSGKGHGKHQVNFLHEHPHAQPVPEDEGHFVATLESDNRYVDISNLDKHFPKLSNRFAALSQDDVDYSVPMKVGPCSVTNTTNGQRKPRTRWERKLEIGAVGVCQKVEVSHLGKTGHMDLTIDSGAGENVMPGHLAPNTPVTESTESGTMYTAANGDMMPNRGCKRVKVRTQEGQLRTMNMQVTDVNRALLSVAKICDTGHTVTFTSEGGTIRNTKSGEETKFRRENNVYRLAVQLSEQGFPRQG